MHRDDVSRETLIRSACSADTVARLQLLVDLLLRWNPTVNLIGRADEPFVWERHIADSLQLCPYLACPGKAVDLGSGAGFPGLVLAIATRVPFTLVEADHRKAAFLREAARVTGAPARVRAARIEDLSEERFPLLTARAVAPLTQLLDMAVPHLSPGGRCLFLKGAAAAGELTAAEAEWQMTVERFPSRTAPGASILRISEITRAGARK